MFEVSLGVGLVKVGVEVILRLVVCFKEEIGRPSTRFEKENTGAFNGD